MDTQTPSLLSHAAAEFEKTLVHLKEEYSHLQAGRANAGLVENVPVEMYGVKQPIKALASIFIPDAKTIQIQPWDKSALHSIEKAIVGVGTGLNPLNDGICVRVIIPPLTEQRRAELTKNVKDLAETARISVRNMRHDTQNTFKTLKSTNNITEDELYTAGLELQKKVDAVNAKIDEAAAAKEKEIMTV